MARLQSYKDNRTTNRHTRKVLIDTTTVNASWSGPGSNGEDWERFSLTIHDPSDADIQTDYSITLTRAEAQRVVTFWNERLNNPKL